MTPNELIEVTQAALERGARAAEPDLWRKIDQWREAAVCYRRTPFTEAGFQDAEAAGKMADDCDRKAKRNADPSIERAAACFYAMSQSTLPATSTERAELDSFDKFDGVGPHSETIETRARIGERYLEAYESALSSPLLAGYMPADCPSELLLDLLARLEGRTALACGGEAGKMREALEAIESLCTEEIQTRFGGHSHLSVEQCGRKSKIYALLVLPRNLARAALSPTGKDR